MTLLSLVQLLVGAALFVGVLAYFGWTDALIVTLAFVVGSLVLHVFGVGGWWALGIALLVVEMHRDLRRYRKSNG